MKVRAAPAVLGGQMSDLNASLEGDRAAVAALLAAADGAGAAWTCRERRENGRRPRLSNM
jgi:hypothetical protein